MNKTENIFYFYVWMEKIQDDMNERETRRSGKSWETSFEGIRFFFTTIWLFFNCFRK